VGFKSEAALLMLVTFAMSGCVPFPTKTIEAPGIEGRLYRDGVPVENMNLKFSYNAEDACSVGDGSYFYETTTNDEGHFKIPIRTGWSFVRWAVPVHSFAYFNICFENNQGEKRWFYHSEYRTPTWAPSLKLHCEYDRLEKAPQKLKPGQYGFKREVCGIEYPWSQS
jgi:hypothetical protein